MQRIYLKISFFFDNQKYNNLEEFGLLFNGELILRRRASIQMKKQGNEIEFYGTKNMYILIRFHSTSIEEPSSQKLSGETLYDRIILYSKSTKQFLRLNYFNLLTK